MTYRKVLIVAYIAGVIGGILVFQSKIYSEESKKDNSNPKISANSPQAPTDYQIPTNSNVFPQTINISEKATFTLSYANRTSKDLKDIQLLILTPPGGNLMFANRVGAVFNETETANSPGQIFDLPDINAGKTKYISIYVYSSTPGKYSVQSQIRAGQTQPTNIPPITITIK